MCIVVISDFEWWHLGGVLIVGVVIALGIAVFTPQGMQRSHLPRSAPVLQAATRQDMTYWLQELQQKRWEYCNNLDAAQRDSRTSPTPSDFSKGLVAKDSPGTLGCG